MPSSAYMQVGYISEYPHTGASCISSGPEQLPLDQLFWGGVNKEVEGRHVFGQVWPKVGEVGPRVDVSVCCGDGEW